MTSTKPKILLTSALPYANGSIHIGHLVEYIQTDIFSRFMKLTGEDIIYCCADDAHGTAIEIKASQEGIKPEELIAKVNKEHQDDFKLFHINFDNYYSTHSDENRELSIMIYTKAKEKGLIYTKEIESFYDETAKRFLPDRYIKGKCPKCGAEDQYGDVCEKCNSTYKPTDLIDSYSTISNTSPVRKKTKHYFFKLSAMTDKLKEYFKNKNFQPEVTNYLNNWLEDGLQDWDISRDGPYFGFKIPGEEDKYFYVWLDAPIGYLASCKNYCGKNNIDFNEYLTNKNNKMIHVIGKDIMYFHYLFWPAMLMAADVNIPDDILTHGFLTINKEKMSKSRGTFILAKQFADMYNPEYLRFYYAKVLSRKMADIDLDFDHFIESVNTELVANLGNLCYRTLSFLNRSFESKLCDFNDDDYPLIKDMLQKVEDIKKNYSEFNLNRAMSGILEVSSMGNKFFQENAPWALVKENKLQEAQKVCSVCANIAKILSIITAPVLPVFSDDLAQQLGVSGLKWDDIDFSLKNHTINKAQILIKKIEEKVPLHEHFPANLKVAEVKEAKLHPDSEKLLILQVDIGEEKPRQIVAGIQAFYTPEEVVGKKIIIVSNLKAAKLGGEISQGMLLAASCKDVNVIKLLEAPKGEPGDMVRCGALESNQNEIKIDEFFKIKIKTKDGKVYIKSFDSELMLKGEALKIDVPDGYEIG